MDNQSFGVEDIRRIRNESENIYFLHACKKQKGKAEKFDLDKAVSRAKEFGLKID